MLFEQRVTVLMPRRGELPRKTSIGQRNGLKEDSNPSHREEDVEHDDGPQRKGSWTLGGDE